MSKPTNETPPTTYKTAVDLAIAHPGGWEGKHAFEVVEVPAGTVILADSRSHAASAFKLRKLTDAEILKATRDALAQGAVAGAANSKKDAP